MYWVTRMHTILYNHLWLRYTYDYWRRTHTRYFDVMQTTCPWEHRFDHDQILQPLLSHYSLTWPNPREFGAKICTPPHSQRNDDLKWEKIGACGGIGGGCGAAEEGAICCTWRGGSWVASEGVWTGQARGVCDWFIVIHSHSHTWIHITHVQGYRYAYHYSQLQP